MIQALYRRSLALIQLSQWSEAQKGIQDHQLLQKKVTRCCAVDIDLKAASKVEPNDKEIRNTLHHVNQHLCLVKQKKIQRYKNALESEEAEKNKISRIASEQNKGNPNEVSCSPITSNPLSMSPSHFYPPTDPEKVFSPLLLLFIL